MKSSLLGINSVLLGILTAGLSVMIVYGSFLLAFTEGGQSPSTSSYPTLEIVEVFSPSPVPSQIHLPTASTTPTAVPSISPTPEPTITTSASPIPSACDLPQGWTAYTVVQNDTLRKLAEPFGLTPQQLADANCLLESRLVIGSILFLPPQSPTTTPNTCGAPSNWITYIVQPGDTLFSIAQRVNSSLNQLILANCLTSSSIHTGQRLYVPRQPSPIPSPTSIPPTKPPPPPTNTPLPLPTSTPTDSNVSRPQPTLAPSSPTP
jgi:LysM repeat protein